MDYADDPLARIKPTPPIPEDGLAEALGTWAGRGYLWDALAAPTDIRSERQWSRRDLVSRAHRVLLERVAPMLSVWPSRLASWIDALPAAREHSRLIYPAPFSGVSWPDTRRRFGWPPTAFVGRQAERGADTLLMTTLRWTLDYLTRVRADAIKTFPGVDIKVRDQLDAAAALLRVEPVASAPSVMPGYPEIMALRHEGNPWNSVANVADQFRAIEASVVDLAWRLIVPDDEIRWRLFHLAVLGVLLAALRTAGWVIMSRRPLGGSAAGPNYTITDLRGLSWDLWFEAAGIWDYEGERSPYREAALGVPGGGRALGADVLLIQSGNRALVVECKYSPYPDIIARDGYLQAVTYATELRSRLVNSIVSLVVGPTGVITAPGFTETCVGRIGIVPPSCLVAEINRFIDE